MHISKKILKEFLLFLMLMLFAGLLSISYGMERTYDVRNYHIYNPFAFLTDRLTTDILPAGIQTYYNPLLDIPYYLAVKYFNNHPFFVTFLYGFSYALFLFIIYKIARLIFKNYKPWIMTVFSLLVASGALSIIRYVGWLSHDIFVADLMLIAIYLLLNAFDREYHPKLFLISGLLAGCAVGAKYTVIIHAIPLFICLLIFNRQFKSFSKSIGLFCLGGFVGFLLTDGFWLYKLYVTFGNPFYPHFNWLFNSSDIGANNIFTLDYAVRYPSTQKDRWLAPFYVNKDEIRFRILWIAFVINLFLLPFIKKEKFKNCFNINITQIDFILLFCFFAYIFWINIFPVPRYFSPILGFTGIVTVVVLFKIYSVAQNMICEYYKIDNTTKLINTSQNICLGLILIFMLILCFPNYRQPKENKLVRASIGKQILYVEDKHIPDDAVVLVKAGCGITIPFQNPKARYFHINAIEFTKENVNILSDKNLQYIKNEIKKHKDNVYFLTDINPQNKFGADIKEIENKLIKNLELRKNMSINEQKRYFAITITEAIFLELDRLGIDTSSATCQRIDNNIRNNEYRYNVRICKLQIK